MILFVDTGSCPTGWSELSQSGNYVLLTVSGNADAGTSGGSNNYTPAGTNSTASFTPIGTVAAPVFTGSVLATHVHELPFQIPSTTTTRQLAAATFGTGTSRAATAVSTTGTANTTSAAVALSQAISAGTPAGTNSAPTFTGNSGTVPAEAWTGNQATIQPTFLKLIGCKKT